MDPLTLTILIILVFGVAFIYSNLGLGGGLLYVPIMLSLLPEESYPKEVVVPISLTFTIATAISATINHHQKGFVDFSLAAILIMGALIGAVAGALFNLSIDRTLFITIFVLVLVLMGSKMLWDWYHNQRSEDENDDTKLTAKRKGAAATGTLASGFTSGSLGIGGGLVNVPLMVYLLGRRTRVAIGTSSMMIVFTAAFGFMSYTYFGTPVPIDYNLILLLWPFVFVGGFIGSRWGLRRLKSRSVALIFIIVLFLAAAKMVMELVVGA